MGIKSNNLAAIYHDFFSRSGTDASLPVTGFTATGGNANAIAPGNGWIYHTFTSPGTLTLSKTNLASTKSLEILLVGGGGGGGVANNNGSDGGGGAGAGGVVFVGSTTLGDLGDGTYNVTVGPGGTGVIGGSSPGSNAIASQVGSDSTVVMVGPNAELRAKGGGGGGSGPIGGPLGPYGTGGSGGGGGGGGGAATPHYGLSITNTPQPLLPSAIIVQYGQPGSYGANASAGAGYEGGGGGGAGGGASNGFGPGAGGPGQPFPEFTGPLIGVPALAPLNGSFGGGGAGGTGGPGTRTGHPASPGGGGSSPNSDGPRQGGSGVTNSGGGGAGASGAPSPPNPSGNGGNGGTGIVIFRYRSAAPLAYTTRGLLFDWDPKNLSFIDGQAIPNSSNLNSGIISENTESGTSVVVNGGSFNYQTESGGHVDATTSQGRISVTGTNIANALDACSSMTITCWFQSNGASRQVLVSRFGTGFSNQFNHIVDPTGDFHYNYSGAIAGASGDIDNATDYWSVNTWHLSHCVYNVSDGVVRWYINGSQVATNTIGTDSGNGLTISSGGAGFGIMSRADRLEDLVGRMGPVRIHNVALTASECSSDWSAERARFGL